MSVRAALSLLTDVELERMRSRAWVRASRVWGECRVERNPTIRKMLSDEAFSEEEFVNACIAEMSRRAEARRKESAA
jgi:hypothetical protein